MRVFFAAILAITLTAAVAPGQDAATQDAATQPADSVATLIAQLSDPVFGVREKAEQSLEAMGPAIAGQLRDAERTNLPDETRARIEHILAQFDEQMALHASITMHYKDAPLTQVLDDFAGQSGGRLGIDDPPMEKFAQGRTVSIDLEQADFWHALRVLCKTTGLATSIGISGLVLSPIQGRPGMPVIIFNRHAIIKDGLLIAPLGVHRSSSIDYTTDKITDVMSLPISIYPEPKLHIMGMMNPEWLKQCVDEKGNSLISKVQDRRFFPAFMLQQRGIRQWMWNFGANLQRPADMGTKIARLKGELDFWAQTRAQSMEIDDINNPQAAAVRDGTALITVIACSKAGQIYRLTVRFTGAAVNSPEFLDFANTAQLADDQGQTVQRMNYLPPRQFPGGMDVQMAFQPTEITPTKIQWERTLEQKRFSVAFEIDDLPLPGL